MVHISCTYMLPIILVILILAFMYLCIKDVDPEHAWPALYDELRKHLPLINVNNNGSLLSKVFIDFVPQNSSTRSILFASEQSIGNIYILPSDDLEIFKSTGSKAAISHWLESGVGKKLFLPLIVIINSGVNRKSSIIAKGSSSAMFNQRQYTLSDKIKAEFKGIRVVQVSLSSDGVLDLVEVLKEITIVGFNQLVSNLEEEARRLEAQKQLPGWNFNIYFIAKEALSLAYESVGLYQNSLEIYDNLEKDFRLSELFLEQLCTEIFEFDIKSLEELASPIIRESIYQSHSGLFKLSCYLFARQSQVLIKLNRLGELLARPRKFIAVFTCVNNLEKSRWTYNLMREFLCISNQYVDSTHELSSDEKNSYEFYRAELMLACRSSLECLKPTSINSVENFNFKQEKFLADRDLPTLEEINDNPLHFIETFIYLSLKAREIFASFKLDRREMVITFDLANFFSEFGWFSNAIEIFQEIGNSKFEKWPEVGVELAWKHACASKSNGDIDDYTSNCVEILNNYYSTSKLRVGFVLSKLIGSDQTCDAHLDVNIFPFSICQEESSSQNLVIKLHNELGQNFYVTELIISVLKGPDEFKFVSKNFTISEGENLISLGPKSPMFSNSYTLSTSSISFNKVRLNFNLLNGGKKLSFHLNQGNEKKLQVNIGPQSDLYMESPTIKIQIASSSPLQNCEFSFNFEKMKLKSVALDTKIWNLSNSSQLKISNSDSSSLESFLIAVESIESDTVMMSVECDDFVFTDILNFEWEPKLSISQSFKMLDAEKIVRCIELRPTVDSKYAELSLVGPTERLDYNSTLLLKLETIYHALLSHSIQDSFDKLCIKVDGYNLIYNLEQISNNCLLNVELQFNPNVFYVGNSTEVTFSVTSDNPAILLNYFLIYEDSEWRVDGVRCGVINELSASHPFCLKFSLIPLVSGKLRLPFIRISSNSEHSIYVLKQPPKFIQAQPAHYETT